MGTLDDLGYYLRRSYDEVAKGARSLRDLTNPFQYARPATEFAASMLPGSGLVQGAQDARATGDAFRRGDYGQAFVSGLSSLGNTGLEMLGPIGHAAMAVAPAAKALRASKPEMRTLYHGTSAPQDFARFDPFNGANPHSAGTDERAVFLSPTPGQADAYTGRTTEAAGAGPRMFKVHVDPGNTAVLDIPEMIQNNPDFVEFLHQRARGMFGRRSDVAPDVAEAASRRRLDEYRQRVEQSNANLAASERAMIADGLGATDPAELEAIRAANARVPLSTGAIPAAVQWARQQGLDTATLRGMAEQRGADQVVALTPGRVWNALTGKLMYGAPLAAGLGYSAQQQEGR